MTYKELLHELAAYCPGVLLQADLDTTIYTAQLVDGPVTGNSETLYIAKTLRDLENLFLSDAEKIYNIFLLEKGQTLPEQLKCGKRNLCCLDRTDGYRLIMEAIAAITSREMELQQGKQVLNNGFFSNRGNQFILEQAHEVFGCPVVQVVFTNDTVLLSYDDSEIASSANLKETIGQIRCGKLKSSAQVLSQLFDEECTAFLSGEAEMELLCQKNQSLGMEQMSAQLRVNSMEVGVITLLSCGKTFSETDKKLLQHLCVLVGQELQKKSLYARNPNEVKAQFLNHLITSHTVSDDYIYHMTQLRAVTEVKDKFYLLVLESTDDVVQTDPKLFSNLLSQIRPILLHGLYLIRDTELVILLNLPEKANVHELIDHILIPKCEKYHLIAGISNMYRDLRDTAKYYHQAQKSATLGAVYKDSLLNYFSDIAPKEILSFMARHEDLLSFCVPEMMDLLAYDKEKGTQLTDTLYVYLEHVGSSSRAAKELYIHKNTLLYRISKIKEILQCDLEKGEDIYKLMMSMRILRTLSLYLPPEKRNLK